MGNGNSPPVCCGCGKNAGKGAPRSEVKVVSADNQLLWAHYLPSLSFTVFIHKIKVYTKRFLCLSSHAISTRGISMRDNLQDPVMVEVKGSLGRSNKASVAIPLSGVSLTPPITY